MRSTFVLLALVTGCGVLTTPEVPPPSESREIRTATTILAAPPTSFDSMDEQIIGSVLRDIEIARLQASGDDWVSERMARLSPTFVHLTRTATMDMDNDRDKDRSRTRAYLREHLGPHDDVIEALIKRDEIRHSWPSNMRLPQGVQLDGSGEIEQLFASGRSWKEYYERYPSSAGVVTLSLPGVSTDGQTAVIYAGIVDEPLSGIGKVLLLKREGPEWKITARVVMWIS